MSGLLGPAQLLRLLHINRVLVRHGLDDIVLATHLFRPVGFLRHLLPWNWMRREELNLSRGERIRLALEDLGPIFVKFGQMLSTRRDLLPDDIAEPTPPPPGTVEGAVSVAPSAPTPLPGFEQDNLMINGLYRFVRNPMYACWFAVLLGEAIHFRSRDLLFYLGFWFLFFHLKVLLFEEPALRKKHGESYARYCATVPRWIPHMPGLRRKRTQD